MTARHAALQTHGTKTHGQNVDAPNTGARSLTRLQFERNAALQFERNAASHIRSSDAGEAETGTAPSRASPGSRAWCSAPANSRSPTALPKIDRMAV